MHAHTHKSVHAWAHTQTHTLVLIDQVSTFKPLSWHMNQMTPGSSIQSHDTAHSHAVVR